MHRFVGKAAPKTPAPTVADTTKALQSRQSTLDDKIKQLDKELFEYKIKIKNSKGPAQAAIKQRAMAVLKRKKMLEKQREQSATQEFNLDQTTFAMESLQTTKQTLGTMKEASKQMKKELKTLNMDKIEDQIDDMAEHMEEFEELNEMMSRSWGVPLDVDEDDLDAELAGLDEELFEEEQESAALPDYLKAGETSLPKVPSANVPSAKAPLTDEEQLDKLRNAEAY